MILTIKGADFSSANIGTLDTFSIRKSIGKGTVHSIPNFVTKNSSVEWTITLDEGYIFDTYSITIGGVEVIPTVVDNVMTITIPEVTGIVIIAVATENVEEEPEIPSDAVLLAVNNKTMEKYSRLNANAYVANMKQVMPKNTIISYIDIALADNSLTDNANAVTSTASLAELSVYAFNAETHLMIETIIDSEPVTSFYSEEFGKHAVRAIINKKYDVPVYFGYDNVQAKSTNSIGCAYYSEGGNYLSGTPFDPNTPLSPTSSVAILCAIYGTPATADNTNYTKVVSYSLDATSTAAQNCWIAGTTQTIPANTNIGKVAVLAKGDVIGFNMAVVNAETNTLVEYLATEQSQPSVYSDDAGANVIEFETDKTYTYPVYLIFNAERPNTTSGIQMKGGGADPAGSAILYVDDREGTMGSPEVGYVFTPSSSYTIGHIVYSKN